MKIRAETAEDNEAIAHLIRAAFALAEHASGQEARIVERLRAADRLTLSLIAEDGGHVVGHAAFSPVTISDGSTGWYGLGPVAVLPGCWRRGVGRSLVDQGLQELRAIGARGCVVLGDPAYYRRFGFRAGPDLVLPGVPGEYFQSLRLRRDAAAKGVVAYDAAFED
ncbi:MAG: N-acetyltransferase [Caulobacter sp.]|nr:N-acetyltransferase [Caulobacter sp.]